MNRGLAPLVSVLLPVRDGEAFLGAALRSVLGQSLRDLELIVVDDHSGDGSAALAAAVARDDARVRVVPAEGRGLPEALNQGLALCRGRFVARMDADDLCRPGRLKAQAAFLEAHPETGVLGGQMRCFGTPGPRQYRYPTTHAAIQASAIFDCPMVHPAVMFRASLCKGGGVYDVSLGNGTQDYGLWTRWLEEGVRFASLPAVVLDYRVHPSQVTALERSSQVRAADGLRRRWLRRLGLDPGPQDMDLHRGVGQGRWGRGLEYLSVLERWFLKLRAAGEDAAFLDRDAFHAVLAQRWTAALWANRGLGAPLRRLARVSPLRRLRHSQPWKSWAPWLGSFLPAAKESE